MRRFLASVGVVALVTLTLVTLVGSSADAVVPGPNGQIAFTGNGDIRTVDQA